MSYEHLPFRVTLTKPDASTVDLTDRVTNSDVVKMDESCEEGFGELRHGDITMDLDDADGTISAIFTSVDPEQKYEILVERRTSASDATWLKVFLGVLDFPWSYELDLKRLIVKFHVFSYSKVLENTDASTVKRTFDATIIASVSPDSDVVTLTTGTTSNFKAGDKFTLGTEPQTIKTVDSSTQLTSLGLFREGKSKQTLTNTTPYHRNKSLAFLVDALFDAAGIATNTIDMDFTMATVPFLTGFSIDGIQTSNVESLTQYSGNLAAWLAAYRYEATAPDSGFGAGTSQSARADWTRYLAAQPGSVLAGDTSTQAGYDHTNSYTYTLHMWYETPPGRWRLDLRRNGTLLSNVAMYSDVGENFDGYPLSAIDYDPVQDRVWVSYSDELGATPTRATKYYSVSGGTWTTVSSTYADLCSCAIESKMIALEEDAKVLRLYAVASPSTGDPTLEYPDGLTYVKTFQEIDNYYVAIVNKDGNHYLCMWDKSTRAIASYSVMGYGPLTQPPRITKWTYSGNETCVIAAGGAMWILSRKFLGTIPYADFSDKSCQAALKDLAIAAGAYVYVDLSKVGKFISRFSTTPIFNGSVITLGDKYEMIYRPIWQLYRNRVEVSGQAQDDGEDVQQSVGSNAFSSRVVSVSSDFIQNNSQAAAVAQMYYTYLCRRMREWEMSIPEPDGTIIHILDRVQLSLTVCRVLSVESDLKKRVQKILIAEEE